MHWDREPVRGDATCLESRLQAACLPKARRRQVRAGFSRANWEISAVVSNLFDSHRPVFGTFNENRQSGVLERFLTPINARSFKLIVRRGFGGNR